ncbi:hypothetical protein B0H14DRAFT_3066624 [Mycena olivaceomarginata]|nr:hypothetical protein B0H14DRAFT_3066624 [Mycena olivaceomarginata]
MSSIFVRLRATNGDLTQPCSYKPLRFGVLGAAAIAPTAFIAPVKSHPEAVVYAVAARSKERAAAFAKTWNRKGAYYAVSACSLR